MSERWYRFTRPAEVDLLEIWNYYFEQSGDEDIAVIPLREIASVLDRLVEFPMLGKSRDELRKGCRSLSAGKFVIYYRPEDNGITVVRVIHRSRMVTSEDFPGYD
jgi:toxin ParE1/3/4